MDTTPNRQLPLLEGTDLIQHGDEAISGISAELDSSMRLTAGPIANRPATAPVGDVWYGTDTGTYTVYVAGTWLPLAAEPVIGSVSHFAGATISDPRWIFAEGQAVSRTTYAKLYQALGAASSPWGQGNGTSTFNVPDLRGRTIIGSGAGTGLSPRALGDAGGTESAVAPLPAHAHTTHDPGHQHAGTTAGAGAIPDKYTTTDGAHNHNDNTIGFINVIGIAAPAQYYSYDAYWKLWNGVSYNGSTTTTVNGAHAHIVPGQAAHTHTFATDGRFTGVVVQSSGSGDGTHPNMQPFAALRPIIRAL